MSEIGYKLYGKIQWIYHALRGRNKKNTYKVYYAYNTQDSAYFLNKDCVVNGQKYNNGELLFKGDNIIEGVRLPVLRHLSMKQEETRKIMTEVWLDCIKSAKVEKGWKNSGFYLTAYTKEKRQWCLSNWIWTSAAIARVLSKCDLKREAKEVADVFLREQLPEGGWIVRYDFIDGHLNRIVAPNDSAYIANNALLTVYNDTLDEKYLDGAEKCAEWIMKTSCDDGLVLFGYNVDKEVWITNRNIVDIGFTAGLFAKLYKITKKEVYRDYMVSFINSFIKTFYDTSVDLFASHVNGERRRNGGYFSRGQAWAMEGIIEAYTVLKNPKLFEIMEKLTDSIISNQLKDGGWYCNFQKSRSMMGEDCKGISVIARSLLDWVEFSNQKEELINSAKNALKWCMEHTDYETGMILSFSCSGDIVHSQNNSNGILYANAYAIELAQQLRRYGVNNA